MNKRHQAFIDEYFLCNMNQTAAYLKVYPKSSYNAARSSSADLLANPSISVEIARRLKEKQMSVDEVLARLADMAAGSHADFADVHLREDLKGHSKAHLIKTIVTDVYEDAKGKLHHKMRMELYDAQAALVHIGKQHGLFTDKIEVKLAKEIDAILDTLESVLDADSYQRALQALSAGISSGSESTRTD